MQELWLQELPLQELWLQELPLQEPLLAAMQELLPPVLPLVSRQPGCQIAQPWCYLAQPAHHLAAPVHAPLPHCRSRSTRTVLGGRARVLVRQHGRTSSLGSASPAPRARSSLAKLTRSSIQSLQANSHVVLLGRCSTSTHLCP